MTGIEHKVGEWPGSQKFATETSLAARLSVPQSGQADSECLIDQIMGSHSDHSSMKKSCPVCGSEIELLEGDHALRSIYPEDAAIFYVPCDSYKNSKTFGFDCERSMVFNGISCAESWAGSHPADSSKVYRVDEFARKLTNMISGGEVTHICKGHSTPYPYCECTPLDNGKVE